MEFQRRIRLHRGYGATGYSDYSDGTRKGGTKAGVLTSFLLSTLPNYPCNPCDPRFNFHSFSVRNLNAFAITETELRLIAAPAMMGLSSKPKNG